MYFDDGTHEGVQGPWHDGRVQANTHRIIRVIPRQPGSLAGLGIFRNQSALEHFALACPAPYAQQT